MSSNVQVVDDLKSRDTNRHISTITDIIRFDGQNRRCGTYKKYWKFLPRGNIGWFNDVDEKTSRKILVRLGYDRLAIKGDNPYNLRR